MPLRDRAVLVLEREDGRIGEFHMMGAESTGELNREELMGNRGQAVREVYDIFLGDGEVGQEGYSIDAGQGTQTITLSWQGGHERESYDGDAVQWGDGSSDARWDATGADPLRQMQMLLWWARTSRSDSFRPRGRLHWGEWTDGSVAGTPGVFEAPMPITVSTVRVEEDGEQPSSFSGTLEVKRIVSTDDLPAGASSDPAEIPDY